MTGANGFLGSHLLARLVDDGHNVIAIIRQTSSLKRIESYLSRISVHTVGDTIGANLFLNNRIDSIIHCATNYGRGDVDSIEILNANLILPLQLLQTGCRAGVRCFINTDTILDKGVNDYALSKSQFREWLGNYAQKMVCVNVALEHFYGPLDDPTKFVSFVVKQFLDEADVIDLTLGEQKRDFIYIDDIVSAFKLIISKARTSKSGYIDYEIGTGNNISIRQFVELAKRISGNTKTQLNFGSIPYRENEVMETSVNTRGIRSLGWEPRVSLEKGLAKMISIEREART